MKVGAGCIPVCCQGGEVLFLFHSMIKRKSPNNSKKEGYYVDCGGGGREGETIPHTAIREFHEETMWVYAEYLGYQSREMAVDEGIELIKNTQATVYQTICWEYHCFFITLPHIEIDTFNTQFESKRKAAGEKPRQFHWLTLNELEQCIHTGSSQASENRIRPLYTRYNKPELLKQAKQLATQIS